MHAVPKGIIFVRGGCDQMHGLSGERDLGNRKHFVCGMRVQCRILGCERRDMLGM